MSAALSTGSLTLKPCLYFGGDKDLQEAVNLAIMSKYTLEVMHEVPHIWPESVGLVFLEYQGDDANVLERVNQILTLARGVAIYILLKEKNADFIIAASHQGVQGFVECPDEVFQILSILHMQDRRRQGKTESSPAFSV